MSILLGPFEDSNCDVKCREEGSEELLVFGYGCKLYRDDAKALLEDSGQLLIPWMGDASLMVDRYDIRNRLDDKSQFGLKPNLPYRMTPEEEALEDELDRERYLSLGVDVREEELREEEKKRTQAGANYAAIGFTYDQKAEQTVEPHLLPVAGPVQREHPPTSSVDIAPEDDGDVFVPPPCLRIPESIPVPATNKLHSIIERTAVFINRQGPQLEIIIKTKQKYNPYFSFLNHEDRLYPYYRHVLSAVSNREYSPGVKSTDVDDGKLEGVSGEKPWRMGVAEDGSQAETEGGEENGTRDEEAASDTAEKSVTDQKEEAGENSEEDEDSEDEGFELHPLLRPSTAPRSPKPSSPSPPSSSTAPKTTEVIASTSAGDLRTSDAMSFYSKRLSVNSAPSLEVPRTDHYRGGYSAGHGYQDYHSHQHPYESYPEGRGHPHREYYDGASYYNQAYAYQMHNYQHNLQAYYHALSAHHIQSSGQQGPTPPPPDLQPIVDKTALYVAKNDDAFESTVLEKHAGDPRFRFLNPWDQYHRYYQAKKREYKEKIAREEEEKENYLKSKPNLQRLDPSGAISFKLQTKSPKVVEPSVDLSTEEEGEGGGEEGRAEQEMCNGDTESRSIGADGEPEAKRPRYSDKDEEEEEGEEDEGDKIDNKVQEFLSTVKAMLGSD